MTDTLNLPELPPLPKTPNILGQLATPDVFTADQMRAYATAAVLAERESLRKLLTDAAEWAESVHEGEYPYHPFTRDELVERLQAAISHPRSPNDR